MPATYNHSILRGIADHKELSRDAVFHCIKSNNEIVLFDVIVNVSEILCNNGVDNDELADSLVADALNWLREKRLHSI